MKGLAFVVGRPGEKPTDFDDFVWLQGRMMETAVEYDPVELLEMILGWSKSRRGGRQDSLF
jgi:hypothetical protein